jgi:uncharacterized protein (TIRG00374 family)
MGKYVFQHPRNGAKRFECKHGGRVRKKRNWGLGILVSSIALIIAFWGVQPARMINVLADANYLYLIPIVILVILGLATRARSWQVLMDEQVSLRQSFKALNEGYLLNTVLPFRLGELARAYLISREGQISSGHALAAVVAERFVDAVVCLIGLLIALPWIVNPQWANNVAFGITAVLVAALAIFLIIAYKRDKIQAILARLPKGGLWKLVDTIGEFFEGLELFQKPTLLGRAAFWSLMAWWTAWLSLAMTIRMFGLESNWIVWLFVSGIIAFGAAVPSMPGAVGVYELSAVTGLMIFGYSQETALSIAVLGHMVQLAITAFLGAAGLTSEGETIAGLAAKTRELMPQKQTITNL